MSMRSLAGSRCDSIGSAFLLCVYSWWVQAVTVENTDVTVHFSNPTNRCKFAVVFHLSLMGPLHVTFRNMFGKVSKRAVEAAVAQHCSLGAACAAVQQVCDQPGSPMASQ
jgi:hypothetical protein